MIKKTFHWLVVSLIMFLAACTRYQKETAITSTPQEQPTAQIAPLVPPESPAVDTPAAQLPAPIVYYYFVGIEDNAVPEGSVVILPDDLILAPAPSNITHGPDTATNIGSALQAMINDSHNKWTGRDLVITDVTFTDGHADVVLQGNISATGDIILVAARMQILMTVFANTSVQTAAITLDGESIGNLGISHSSEARPVDHVYTRTEIETFMTENAYGIP